MRKLTFDELWSIKWDVWNAYSHLFRNRPLINHPRFDWFSQHNHEFERLRKAFETINDSEPEEFDPNSERGLETYSIYINLLSFAYFIYYALSLRIKRNGFVEERAVCIQKIRECLTKVSQKNPKGWFSPSSSAYRVYSEFNIFNWENKNIPLHFKADKWLNDRLQDFQNFASGSAYNNAYTSFHLWLLCRFCTCDWENVWLQGDNGTEERFTFFSLAQYCAYASFPQKLYQNINNFIIKDFLTAPLDNREYVVYSLKTKQIRMDKGKLWTTIETTSSVVKILYLDLIFRHPNDYKKEEYFYHHIPKKRNSRLFSLHKEFPQIIDVVTEVIKYTSGLCYSNNGLLESPVRRNTDKPKLEDVFKKLFNLPKNILDEYPAFYRLMYLLVPYIDYAKFKDLFKDEINAPVPFSHDDGTYRSDELEKISVKDFIDKTIDIDKISKLLRLVFSNLKKKNPDFSQYFDIYLLKTNAFSRIETSVCLLHNIVLYLHKNASDAIINQINFCGEQRDRLFNYHKVKSSWSTAEKKSKRELSKDEYLYYVAIKKNKCLDLQQNIMNKIDNGFKITLNQKWPIFHGNIHMSRDINVKIFPETDVNCKVFKDVFYIKKRFALMHNKYLYHERNIDTHYTRFNNTEELLTIDNYKDLLELLYQTRMFFLNEETLHEDAEKLAQKEIWPDPYSHLFNSNVFSNNTSEKKCLVLNENYKVIVKELKAIDTIIKKNKNNYIQELYSIIDNSNIDKILEVLNHIKDLDFGYYHFFSTLRKKDEIIQGLRTLSEQIFAQLDKKIIDEFISEEAIDYNGLLKALRQIKEELVKKYNDIIDIIKKNKNEDDLIYEKYQKTRWDLIDIISNVENKVDFYDKIVHLDSFKVELKKHILQLFNNELSDSYAEKYIKLHKEKKWSKIKNLLNLSFVYQLQRVLGPSLFDNKKLEMLRHYKNYYQVEETFSLIEKMEEASNEKFGIDELKVHLKHYDYSSYNKKIKDIAEKAKQKRFIITDAKSELHIDPFVGFDKKELEDSRKKYLSKRFELIQEFIKYRKWDRLKTLLRYIDYYDIPDCSIDASYEKGFLTRCENLMQEIPPFVDSTIREMVSVLQEKAKQRRDYLAIKERSKDLWIKYENIDDFDNPILKKTQELFSQLLYLIGHKEENITRCKSYINSNVEKTFISAEGKIAIPRSAIEDMMEDCKYYNDEVKNNLREYFNTIFCISHICDTNKQEVNFFDLYGDEIMFYLIKVTLELASLKSIKVKN